MACVDGHVSADKLSWPLLTGLLKLSLPLLAEKSKAISDAIEKLSRRSVLTSLPRLLRVHGTRLTFLKVYESMSADFFNRANFPDLHFII